MATRLATLGILVSEALSLNAGAAEVGVSTLPLGLNPANIVIHQGDTVVWLAADYGIVEEFDGAFKSPILLSGGTNLTFAMRFNTVGEFPYRFRKSSPIPPHSPVHTNIEIHGTVEVRSRSGDGRRVWINAPVPGARFGAGSDGEGNVIGNGGHIDVQASVDDTNGIVRMEFLANGVLIGSATNWPFQITWQPARIGPLSLEAIAVLEGGGELESEAVDVSVEGFTGPPSALLGNPRLVRPGIYYVEYTLSPAAWYMEIYREIPFSFRFPEVTVRVNSDWGLVVLTGNEPALFVLPYDRH